MQNAYSSYFPNLSNTMVDPGQGVGPAIPSLLPQMQAMFEKEQNRVPLSAAYDLAMRTTVPSRSPMSFRQEAQGGVGGDSGEDVMRGLMMQEQLEAARLKNRENAARFEAANRPAPTKFVGPDYTSSGFAAHYTQDPSKMSAIQREMFLPNNANVGHIDQPAPRGAMRQAYDEPRPSAREQAANDEYDDATAWSNFRKQNYSGSSIGGRIPTHRGPTAPSNRRSY